MVKTLAEQAREKAAQDAAQDTELGQHLDNINKERRDRPVHVMKEVIEYNSKQFAQLTKHQPVCELMDMNGDKHQGIDPCWPHDPCYGEYRIGFFTPFDFASWRATEPHHTGVSSLLSSFPNLLDANINMYMLPRPFHPRYEPPEHLLNVFKQWENSSIRKGFQSTLSSKWTEEYPASNINKIICFGLGEIYTEVNEEGPAWLLDESPGLDKYLTVLAFEIASFLEVKLGSRVPMIFDDWSYDQQDKSRIEAFATQLNTPISFLSNCEALLQVDKNTLVLAPSRARYNIRELIVDITRDEGGPAGFLCETIVPIESIKHEVAWSKGEKDPPTMLLASMAKDYNMDNVCGIERWGVELYLKRHAIKDPPREAGGWVGKMLACIT